MPTYNHARKLSSPVENLVTIDKLEGNHNSAIETDVEVNKNNNDVPKLIPVKGEEFNIPQNHIRSNAELIEGNMLITT